MSISDLTNRVVYAGDGSSTVFSFAHEFFAQADLKVFMYSSSAIYAQTLNTSFTISGTPNLQGIYTQGGSVVMTSSVPTGSLIVITRDPALVQNYTLLQNGNINSVALCQQLDYLTLICQRFDDRTKRAMRLQDGSAQGFDPQLPFVLNASSCIITNSTATGWAQGPSAGDIINAQSAAVSAGGNATAAAASAVAAAASALASASSAAIISIPLPLSKGGTGLTASTALQVFNIGSPMSAFGDTLYGGTAGSATRLAGNLTATAQVLMQTGSGGASAAPSWVQLIPPTVTLITTKGDGTYTPPAGVKAFSVIIVGGGGGGGGILSVVGTSAGAQGGGAGGSIIKMIQVGSTATGSYTVGTGGAGAAPGNNNGITGSASTFSWGVVALTCGAGVGGLGANSASGSPSMIGDQTHGTGGTATGGDLNSPGGRGFPGVVMASTAWAGYGGNSVFGLGGFGVINPVIGTIGGVGTLGSGGGGGCQIQNGSSAGGGNGGNGVIYITEFYQ